MNETGFLAAMRQIRIPSTVLIRMVISVAVALVLWGFVTTQQDPPLARNFNDLPIQEQGLAEDLEIPVDLGMASVRVEGPTSAVLGISSDSLAPHINVSGITEPGTYIVPVEVTAPGVVEREVTPAQLSIIVDESASRSFTLEWEVEAVADNTREVGEIVPNVTEVTVTGPASIVARVDRVIFTVDIGEQTDSFTGEFETVAVDANGVPIPEVLVRPDRITASVEVVARGRLVPVLVPTSGNPAEGFDVVDRVVSPPAVLLNGPEDVLADLVSVSTESVDIEGASEALTRRVAVTGLPPGVEVVDPANGSVVVVVQFQQRGLNQTLTDQRVLVGDVGPTYEAVAEPATIDVVIFGGEDALSNLRSGDVAPRVTVLGLGPGTYDLRPSVLVPPDVQWIRTDPETVRVTISEATVEEAPTSAPPPTMPPLATPGSDGPLVP